ncbi:hypothetical protein MKW92_011939 [Papaver armeniacum]|nr:hypothetical protein MKW92_011939 [Papaver armeniacum]
MVLNCAKIYPGRGIRFIRSDSQVFLFVNSKCKRYFHNKLKPSKLTWTAMYRKQHKKDIAAEAVKKRRYVTKKPYCRSIVGATLEVIQKRSAETEVEMRLVKLLFRMIFEVKERVKKSKDEKKAKKAAGEQSEDGKHEGRRKIQSVVQRNTKDNTVITWQAKGEKSKVNNRKTNAASSKSPLYRMQTIQRQQLSRK